MRNLDESRGDSTIRPGVFRGAAVSVVVPTYRRPSILADTLRALLNLDYPSALLELVVIDDGSDDRTAETVASFRHSQAAVVYRPQSNCGAAAARNNGARIAHGDIFLFIDDDIILRPGSLQRHLEVLEQYAPCAVNGRWEFSPALLDSLQRTPFGRYRIELEKWVKARIGMTRLAGPYLEAESVTACNLAITRADFWRMGGFDETFPFAGAEDQEFSIRAKAAGLRLIFDEDNEVWHNDHRLTARDFCERQRRGAQSAVWLAVRHPIRYAQKPLIRENLPATVSDPPKLLLKKLGKVLLAWPPMRGTLFAFTRFLEWAVPDTPLLRRLYWGLCGVAIAQGVREGARALAADQRRALEIDDGMQATRCDRKP